MRPFAYLFNTYWSSLQPVVVACYTPPPFELPDNFIIYPMGKDPGQNGWSTGLINVLQWMQDDYFVLMLEDYWLTRTADTAAIGSLGDYIADKSNLLRIDLTTDRLYNGQMQDNGLHWGHCDLVETPHGSPYQMSFQAGIWRSDLLLSLLHPGMTPWQVEIGTQPPEEMRVLGTRQWPLRYLNALKGGNNQEVLNLGDLEEHHREVIKQWTP
jgi:hypothetical protein